MKKFNEDTALNEEKKIYAADGQRIRMLLSDKK